MALSEEMINYLLSGKWEIAFPPHLLKEGFTLFQAGKVKGLKEMEDQTFQVHVLTSPLARTMLHVKSTSFEVSCNCTDFHRDRVCQHEAALFYALENMANSEDGYCEPNITKIQPFGHHITSDEYHYFDLKTATAPLMIYENMLDMAKKLIQEGSITMDEPQMLSTFVDMDHPNAKMLIAKADLHTDLGDYPIIVHLKRDKLDFCNCQCPRCSYQYMAHSFHPDLTPCIHTLALLSLLDDYLQKYNPGDATDDSAQKLMMRFRTGATQDQTDKKQQTILLEPELQNDDGELSIGFRVGVSKMYKIRNLTDFVQTVQDHGTYALGKNGSISFYTDTFTPESAVFYTFIHKMVQDNLYRIERVEARARWGYYRAPVEKITASIPMEGSTLDEGFRLLSAYCSNTLMELASNSAALGSGAKSSTSSGSLDASHAGMNDAGPYLKSRKNAAREFSFTSKSYIKGTEKYTLRCTEGSPKPVLQIQNLKETSSGNDFEGLDIQGELPGVFLGAGTAYFADAHFFYHIPDADYRNLFPLLDLVDESGHLHFQVGRKNLSEFYYSVLPTLESIAEIDDRRSGKALQTLPPPGELTFYLDYEDGTASCQVSAIYGEKEHSPMEVLSAPSFAEEYRNFHLEHQAMQTITGFFPEVHPEENTCTCLDEDGIYRIYKEGVDQFLALGNVQVTDRFRKHQMRSAKNVKIGVSVESDLLNLDIQSGDIPREELLDILASYRDRKKFHVLKNGDFLDLNDESLHSLSELMDTCQITEEELMSDKVKLPLFRALYVDKLLEDQSEIYEYRDRSFRHLIRDFGAVKDSEFDVPESLQKTLRSYQVYGYKWLRTLAQNHFGGILADEMGLGKTLQTIALLLSAKEMQKEEGNCATSLIICPASLVYNWQQECLQFAPQLQVGVIAEGVSERRAQLENYQSYDVLITSYDTLKRDITAYADCEFLFQILDEAQYIKNPKTAAAKAVKVIHSQNRLALTGTPIENRLSELWSIFDYLMPGFLYDYETFRGELELPITKEKDEEASSRLKRMVAPFILRRLKMDVLKDLPEKIEEIRYAGITGEQQKLYNAQVLRITNHLSDQSDAEFRKNKIQILAELTRIRQICCDPALTFDAYAGESAKREVCMELVENAIEGEHRILIFSQFTSMLAILAKELKAREIPFYEITGSTPKQERLKLVQDFNEGTTPVFLISLKAGGTGLNLTGADIVIHYDPWWNLAAQNQATDRAHRIGQTRMVTVYKLICKDTIEEKIVQLQNSKKDLADEILSGENGTIGSLSREDLLELLGC